LNRRRVYGHEVTMDRAARPQRDDAEPARVLVLAPRRAPGCDFGSELELSRLRAGEAGALAALYDEHHAALRVFCQRLLGDASAAEDLVHDSFLALPRALSGYRGEAPVRSFLFGIAVNRCRRHVRAAARRRRATRRYAELSSPATAPACETRAQLARALQRALDQLPLKQRVAFVLSAVQELSVEEVAAVVSAPAGTVKSRLHHARAALQKRLQGVLR
jgi:RNA polymerase sigma-70 factor (ECF subfamily)